MVIAHKCVRIIEEVGMKARSSIPGERLTFRRLSIVKLFHYQPTIGKQFYYSEVNRENFNLLGVDEKIDIICSMEFVTTYDPYGFQLLVMGRNNSVVILITRASSSKNFPQLEQDFIFPYRINVQTPRHGF